MLIQINTDHNISSNEALAQSVDTAVRESLEHISDQITRVEVHLSDENSDQKSGTNEMRCMMEARLAGHQPIIVTHQATTLEQAIDGAAEKLKTSFESLRGRLSTH